MNPVETSSEEKFLKEFAMTRDEVKGVCTLVNEDLISAGRRKCNISLEQKALINLKALGSSVWKLSKFFLILCRSFSTCSQQRVRCSC